MDMGCSTGQFTRVLASEFGESRVHGADISEKSIERCQKRNPKLTFRHIGNGFYRENEGKYQNVLISHVLEHIDRPARMLKKLQSLLRYDGSLIVSVPQERIRGDSALPENMYNLIRFKFENVHRVKHSLGSLSSLLTETGYSYIDHQYIHSIFKAKNVLETTVWWFAANWLKPNKYNFYIPVFLLSVTIAHNHLEKRLKDFEKSIPLKNIAMRPEK